MRHLFAHLMIKVWKIKVSQTRLVLSSWITAPLCAFNQTNSFFMNNCSAVCVLSAKVTMFFQGSYHCGHCLPGYSGNQEDGCFPDRICPDGSQNLCHENADCIIQNRGGKVCEVNSTISIKDDYRVLCVYSLSCKSYWVKLMYEK